MSSKNVKRGQQAMSIPKFITYFPCQASGQHPGISGQNGFILKPEWQTGECNDL